MVYAPEYGNPYYEEPHKGTSVCGKPPKLESKTTTCQKECLGCKAISIGTISDAFVLLYLLLLLLLH